MLEIAISVFLGSLTTVASIIAFVALKKDIKKVENGTNKEDNR